ncbi:MAG: glutathione ABC transporter ATP-binding protein GsiA [Stappia sp.]|uniref:ABC transporter ATP-binding protein n=1 Tax=Stappia sp. TaxID=1870903 RepID=UPI000C659E96|nr:ABC transporter ATP-binding protein [Stappia sp.]MAB00740.1 glutathione ABC transporter ATP-binding protein GsiA [Stappia sp.]MBM18810.1 glutathione ABC transporter ATP-binding protein GsiA [Stappia sp.]
MDQILSVSGLTTSFRVDGAWKPVVRDLDFTIARGETVAIVGESGSGKSVTALSIMRLLQEGTSRIDGSVKLGDTELLALDEAAMRDVRGGEIGMIFQEPMTSLNPVLKIGFQIAEALRRHRGMSQAQAETEVLRLFDLVRIPDAKRRIGEYPHSFSGGMRQRAMIAMALACQPKLLIADEPTTALDVTIQAQILELVRELQQEIGMAVMFITHDMGVVAEISDKVVVMLRGDKVEEAPVADLFRAPRHSYTKMLLGAVPRLGGLGDTKTPRRFPKLDETGAGPEPGNEPDRRGEPILQVKNLTTRFTIRGGLLNRPVGNVHAVEDVSLELAAGETLALVGESGCGKSTTGRSILQLVQPAGGEVLFEGRNLMSEGHAGLRLARQRLQMIFQDPCGSLNPRQAVGSAIAEPIRVHGLLPDEDIPDRVTELLRLVGLDEEHALRFPHEFSGGQRQRICIARSLALEPRVIVADESVSALDASIKAQVVNLMLDLQRELGLAYLFISHDIAVVERVSHRIAVMLLGEIVEIGPRDAVLRNPQHPYTKKLIDAVPIPDPAERRKRGGLLTDELRSPVRPLGWERPPSRMYPVGDGHLVREF